MSTEGGSDVPAPPDGPATTGRPGRPVPPVPPVPGRARAFLRSFAIQGSWNERTMIGSGFAYALLPVLRRRHLGQPERLREAVRRHSEHFNAHPYLAALALGAVARMETEGVSADEIGRFKSALRGPLGALGDRLVWAGVLPLTLLVAVLAQLLGAPPLVVVLLFLLAYNAAHLLLRAWAFRAGIREGREVGRALRRADLAGRAERVRGWLPVVLGGVIGAAAARLFVAFENPWPVLLAGAFAFVGGYLRGRPLVRPLLRGAAAIGVVLLVLGVVP